MLTAAFQIGFGAIGLAILVLLFRNAGSATSFYKIPNNRVVELGTQVVL